MYHYVYLLQSTEDLKFYIGVRSTKTLPAEDIYKSSSKTMTKTYLCNCTKRIIKEFLTRKDAVSYEIRLHKLYNVASNPLFFNAANQTSTKFDTTGVKSPRKGVKLTAETKEKLRQANLGKKQSQETRDKRAAKLKGHVVSEKTRALIGAKNKANLTGRIKTTAQKLADVKDHTKYLFVNDNGTEHLCSIWELLQLYKYNRPTHLYRMAKGLGNARSYKGWRITSPIN
ncbi:MAG: GIY-YIG nuclease family protein [Sulfuricurvum sp.]